MSHLKINNYILYFKRRGYFLSHSYLKKKTWKFKIAFESKEELISKPTTLVQAVKILASILEVTGSNLG